MTMISESTQAVRPPELLENEEYYTDDELRNRLGAVATRPYFHQRVWPFLQRFALPTATTVELLGTHPETLGYFRYRAGAITEVVTATAKLAFNEEAPEIVQIGTICRTMRFKSQVTHNALMSSLTGDILEYVDDPEDTPYDQVAVRFTRKGLLLALSLRGVDQASRELMSWRRCAKLDENTHDLAKVKKQAADDALPAQPGRLQVDEVGITPKEKNAWHRKAACKDLGVDNFFYKDKDYVSPEVIVACGPCPVRRECINYAAFQGEEGVWGATTKKDRKDALRRWRRRQKKAEQGYR